MAKLLIKTEAVKKYLGKDKQEEETDSVIRCFNIARRYFMENGGYDKYKEQLDDLEQKEEEYRKKIGR